MDDAKFRRDNVKEMVFTLFANKVDVDHPENKYKDFKDLEDKVEKGFKIARRNIKMKSINYLRQVLILMIFKIIFLIFDFFNS